MAIRIRKILITLCIIVVVSVTVWFGRYPALYYYYLWRLNHTTAGVGIMTLYENIDAISPHIVPLLVRTYEDVHAPEKSREAAGSGLIKADKSRAETLFISFLDNKNDEIVAVAIYDLGKLKSEKPFKKIIKFAHSPNVKIRWVVADYLGNFNNAESIALLKQMEVNDPDGGVRGWASSQLYRRGIK